MLFASKASLTRTCYDMKIPIISECSGEAVSDANGLDKEGGVMTRYDHKMRVPSLGSGHPRALRHNICVSVLLLVAESGAPCYSRY